MEDRLFFPELASYEYKHAVFAELIPKFDTHLMDMKHHNAYLEPELIAKILDIEETLALVLLNFAHDKNIVKPIYQLYCRSEISAFYCLILLNEFDNINNIPETIYCHYHKMIHDVQTSVEIKLVFKVI